MTTDWCEACEDEDAIYWPDKDPWASDNRPGQKLCHGCWKYRDNYDHDVSFERELAKREGRGW